MKKESDKTTPITKKDISEVFDEFYGKVIEPRFDRIDKKFEEQNKKFNDTLQSRIEEIETHLKTIS